MNLGNANGCLPGHQVYVGLLSTSRVVSVCLMRVSLCDGDWFVGDLERLTLHPVQDCSDMAYSTDLSKAPRCSRAVGLVCFPVECSRRLFPTNLNMVGYYPGGG